MQSLLYVLFCIVLLQQSNLRYYRVLCSLNIMSVRGYFKKADIRPLNLDSPFPGLLSGGCKQQRKRMWNHFIRFEYKTSGHFIIVNCLFINCRCWRGLLIIGATVFYLVYGKDVSVSAWTSCIQVLQMSTHTWMPSGDFRQQELVDQTASKALVYLQYIKR